MATLSKQLRTLLSNVTLDAREAAENACRSSLENLAVHEKEYRPHMSVETRQLRNRLRARGRALGDARDERSGTQEITRLVEDSAYEHWHRLLFTRFLAENSLLHTGKAQGSVPVTLQDCEELASELGARDGFELACRFAGETLPGVFRPQDPVFELQLATNHQVELRKLLESLPSALFTADDSLGWTYQFWQARRKKQVNDSGKKIGADELPAVTQLFTEDYMVEFLLHNTLGAWWVGKLGPIEAETESEARAKAALPSKNGLAVGWTYLRLTQNAQTRRWIPAAGAFDTWPRLIKDVTLLDPCMGSGHFVAFALPLIARLRMEEEGIAPAEAVFSALRDNLHGLEVDPRCAQIGAFNVALSAWKVGGYQKLPSLNIACSGIAPQASEKAWLSIAGGDNRLERGMQRLYTLFKNGPALGSLIDPGFDQKDLLAADFRELQPLLEKVLASEAGDDASLEMSVIARGVAKAAEILASRFTLVATNVPFLGMNRQGEILFDFLGVRYTAAKADLATAFIQRCCALLRQGGTISVVSPQIWLFLGSYKAFRTRMLNERTWNFIARLGPGAFESIGGEVVNIGLFVLSGMVPEVGHEFSGVDVSGDSTAVAKAAALQVTSPITVLQAGQLQNPDARVTLEKVSNLPLLSMYADSYWGIGTGDIPRFTRQFWELPAIDAGWRPLHVTAPVTQPYTGREQIIDWRQSRLELCEDDADRMLWRANRWTRGSEAWGRAGVAISQMGGLGATLFSGDVYQNGVAAIIPKDRENLAAVWAFCSSDDFHAEVRKIDKKLSVTNLTLIKVPFDLAHWQEVANARDPFDVPLPDSDDPTQWLFSGHPSAAKQTLHVAVARLLGYRWPRLTGSSFANCLEIDSDGLESAVDDDGVVCLSALNRERPAALRLRDLLTKALGDFDERRLLASASSKASKVTTLEGWLRDDFFEQHWNLFRERPFIWHVWDGRKDGFHALVNYHKLDHANLQKLTYSYLGDWIRQQDIDVKAQKSGADLRLGAARDLQERLAKVLEGEAPYDIFVRWKPLAKQAIGWHPDLSDGVRMNIRPFVTADVLRKRVKVKWTKDRGNESLRDKDHYPWFWCESEPDRDPTPGRAFAGHRWNDVHLTLKSKRNAKGTA